VSRDRHTPGSLAWAAALALLLALGGLPAGGAGSSVAGPFLDQAPAGSAGAPLDPQRSRVQAGQPLGLTADLQARPFPGPSAFSRSRSGAARDGHRERIDRPPRA